MQQDVPTNPFLQQLGEEDGRHPQGAMPLPSRAELTRLPQGATPLPSREEFARHPQGAPPLPSREELARHPQGAPPPPSATPASTQIESEHRRDTLVSPYAQFFAVIIANPTSGSFSRNAHRLYETLTFLRGQGWKAELWLTKAAGHARQLAYEAVEQKANLVIAAGGDGTINEIIQELAGSETALGVLPTGTVNVWAREAGIPLDIDDARDVLVHGQTRRVDLGRGKDHYFLLMAGVGLDGEVTRAVEKKPLKRWGVLGYVLMGLWLGPGYRGFRVHLYLNGRRIRTNAIEIIIGNTQLLGGFFQHNRQAKCDDGLLDVCLVYKRGLFGRLGVLWDFLRRREPSRLWVRYITCTSVRIRTFQPIAVQLDGDPLGDTPVIFTVAPSALKVVVPEKTREGIFSR